MANVGTTRPPDTHDGFLEIHLLGLVDFESALMLQERFIYEISGRNDLRGALLMCEHPSMISVGREGSREQILASPDDLAVRGMKVVWLNRGGGCMLHAPGQLAAYPILPLERLQRGIAEYRARLEDAVIDTAGEFQISAFRDTTEPGVWCRTGQFAQVGVAVKSWVSYHGIFVDVDSRVESDRFVKPAQANARQSNLSAQTGRPISMNAVRESLARQIASHMGYLRTHVSTGHPLLRREQRKIFVDA